MNAAAQQQSKERPPQSKIARLVARASRPAVVYDLTNLFAMSAIGGGVWLSYGEGAACITVGGIALALNIVVLFRR